MGIETRLFGFIAKNYSKMPPWMRVITYFVALLLFVYFSVQPNTITGRIVVEYPGGLERDFRSEKVTSEFGDNVMKFQTNEYGIFVVPAPRVGDLNIRVDLSGISGGEENWYPVSIGPEDYLFKNIVKLIIPKGKPEIKIEQRYSLNAALELKENIFDEGFFSRVAHAGEIRHGAAGSVPWFDPKNDDFLKNVKGFMLKSIQSITGISSKKISREFPLHSIKKTSLFNWLQFVGDVEKEFDLKIPDEHWDSLKNIDQLAVYIVDRRSINDYYKYERSKNWRFIQKSVPSGEKPKFKR